MTAQGEQARAGAQELETRAAALESERSALADGKREAEEGTVAIRTLGEQQQNFCSLDEAIAMLKAEVTPPDLT